MLHLLKYQFLQIVREWGTMFWALAFPIILGGLYSISFGNSIREGKIGNDMETIKTAVVEETEAAEEKKDFLSFLEELDGDMIETQTMEEKEALKALRADEVEGIFYVGEKPRLTVAKSELEQNILKAILDTYQKSAEVMQTVGKTHPEGLKAAAEALEEWKGTTEEISLGGRTFNSDVSYFFALIAFAALSGMYLGIKDCCDGQANLSPLGARKCITPTHKLKLMLASYLTLLSVQFFNVMVLTGVVQFVYHIDLGGNVPEILLINLLGSMIGVSMGVLIGSISKLSLGMKMGFGVLFTLFPGFLSGLMFGDMKNLIEQHCPVINRINPAAVLSDSYYCMAVYNDTARMTRNLITLAAMSIFFMAVSFLVTRRERYDGI